MTEFREGDVVSIEATVKWTPEGAGRMSVEVDGVYHGIDVPQKAARMVRPNFEVGEAVAWRSDDKTDYRGAIILGMAGNEVWIEFTKDCRRKIVSIGEVERIPAPIAEAQETAVETARAE